MITAANISQDLHSLSHSFSSKMLICVHSSFLSSYPWNIHDIFMLSVSTLCKPPDSGSASGIGFGSSCNRQHRIRCNREACGLQRSTSFLEFFIILPPFSQYIMIIMVSDVFRSRFHLKITWEFLGATWLNRDSTVCWLETSSSMTEIWAMASRMLLASQAAGKIDLLVIYYINL